MLRRPSARFTILFFVALLLLASAPLLVGGVGAYVHELSTGQVCNEANCAWMVLPWLTLLTVPGAVLLGLLYGVYMAIAHWRTPRSIPGEASAEAPRGGR